MPSLRYLILFIIASLFVACFDPKANQSVFDVSKQSLIICKKLGYSTIQESTNLKIKQIQLDEKKPYFASFNRTMHPPFIFLFPPISSTKKVTIIPLNRAEAIVKEDFFENVCNDDQLEQEIIIFKDIWNNPREIFAFSPLKKWESIDTFDQKYGLPKHHKRVEHDYDYTFFESSILLSGCINYRKNSVLTYNWSILQNTFIRAIKKNTKRTTNKDGIVWNRPKNGNKSLVPVQAQDIDCLSYTIEFVKGQENYVPKAVTNALRCSKTTHLSPNGQYLVYTDQQKNRLLCYDFWNKKTAVLLKNYRQFEGFSEILWSSASPLQFGFVGVNHEEQVENTCIYWIEPSNQDGLDVSKHSIKVHYSCETIARCVPQLNKDFKLDKRGQLLYREKNNSDFKILNLNYKLGL